MDLKREAFTGAAQLAAVALTLRRLYQPDFEVPLAMRESLFDVEGKDISWQQVAALARTVQALNTDWNAEAARLAA